MCLGSDCTSDHHKGISTNVISSKFKLVVLYRLASPIPKFQCNYLVGENTFYKYLYSTVHLLPKRGIFVDQVLGSLWPSRYYWTTIPISPSCRPCLLHVCPNAFWVRWSGCGSLNPCSAYLAPSHQPAWITWSGSQAWQSWRGRGGHILSGKGGERKWRDPLKWTNMADFGSGQT